jgi:acetoin utilization deacetylase AcuC-like enzyme
MVYRRAVGPVLQQFSPQLVLVSAGFDAHERDPLASMRVTTVGYGSVVRQLMAAARESPIAFVTEGGYDLSALAECLDTSFAVISRVASRAVRSGSDPDSGDPDESRSDLKPAAAPRAERALQAVRAAQAPFWRGI